MKNFKSPALILFTLILRPWSLADGSRDYFAIWNIGQGSWATLVSRQKCLHFDMGGERGRWPTQVNECLNRPNMLFVSHLDWDHISNIGNWSSRSHDLCLRRPPRDLSLPQTSSGKKRLFKSLRGCEQKKLPFENEIEFDISAKDPNALSRIYRYRQFLLPGDSSRTAEKIWAPLLTRSTLLTKDTANAFSVVNKMPTIAPQILLLGHHGSRTSTSDVLLYNMPNIKLAVASARRAKYGHPHLEVVQRLAAKKIPLLTTQKWGNLLFEI